MNKAIRLAAWGCIVAVVALSLLPADDIVRTDLGGHFEHVLAYAGTALITALAYGERGSHRVLILLILCAAVLEYLQRFSPGRLSSAVDFIFSAVGVLIGVAAFAIGKSLCRVMSNERGAIRRPGHAPGPVKSHPN